MNPTMQMLLGVKGGKAPVGLTGQGGKTNNLNPLTIGVTAADSMVVLMEAGNTSAPSLRSGFTDILTTNNTSGAGKCIRVSYSMGSAGLSFTPAVGASYLVLSNAVGVGVSASVSSATTSGTQTLPTLSGLNTDGGSLIYAISWRVDFVTGYSSPWTQNALSGAGIVEANTSASISGSTVSHAGSPPVQVLAVVEFLN